MSARAEAANRGGDESSSQGLSSPPSASSPSHHTSTDLSRFDPAAARTLKSEENDAQNGGVTSKKAGAAETTRRPRKKRESEPPPPPKSIATTGPLVTGIDGKPKKPRAPRGTSAAYQKKMQKLREEEEKRRQEAEAALQVTRATKPEPPPRSPLPPANFGGPPPHSPHQNGNHEAIQNSQNPYAPTLAPQQQHQQQLQLQQQQRQSSGQNYDPIRSSTVAPRPASPMTSLSTPTKLTKPSSASASPSISSLIDPPDATRQYQFPDPPKRGSDPRASPPPDAKRPRLSSPTPTYPPNRSTTPGINTTTTITADAMDIDTDNAAPLTKPNLTIKKPSPNASTTLSSTSHSPKPAVPRSKGAPVASGSGLLSGSIFGSTGLDSAAGSAPTAPTVVLDVELTGESNQYVNFTQLAEQRYGFNALHPRLAAQRDRLARVAAAGAALENAHKNGQSGGSGMSADDKSVDLSNDEGEDSNVEMGGMNGGGKSGEDTGENPAVKPTRKKRMMKEDMYDKDDGFVDDTELAWEEQAAVSKDGFFVYSGLLVPEGEEAKVERADAPPKRGRGGGRGRGSTRGRGGGAAAAAASAASRDAAKDGKAPVKRSRTTKADKERMEREKAQRENLAPLASKPVAYPVAPVGQQVPG